MYMKSMVELSFTAFRLRLVLKNLTGFPVSVVSGTGMVADAGRRGALERPTTGLSEVRSEENVAGPVIDRERVVVLEVEVRALRARAETRAVDMAVVCSWQQVKDGVFVGCRFPAQEIAIRRTGVLQDKEQEWT
jgi:hypothetical protein